MDVVEVLRATAAGPLLIAASAAGGVAAVAATLTAAVAWPRGRAAPASRALVLLLAVGFTASLVELGLLVADGAAVTDRWPAIVLIRMLLLVALSALSGPTHGGTDAALPARSARGVAVATGRVLLTVGLVLTAVFGAPTATGTLPTFPLALAAAAAVVALVATLTMTVVRLTARRGERAMLLAVAMLLVALAVPAAVALAPDRVPPHQQTQLAVGALTLDLTVAPARAGTNEFHLYAFDADRRPAPVSEVTVAVDGYPDTGHELFPVSPDHHLSYVLELPDHAPWTLQVELVDEDGREHTATWALEASGSSAVDTRRGHHVGPVSAYLPSSAIAR